ncbi:CG10710 [Drosophila busckii]|uniref:CG10710 n=1 Tax=Drosophila busckii TaxID=30019 RepID=A0A0M4EGC0_DROBS|nr:uncharacterized protein LOC108600629 [Drosophila busckii]XP_017843805.1 uncharacterized protein LOC108600629 [Drosophila busckii]ALC45158.1 CG10710 [Drosophila busckii]
MQEEAHAFNTCEPNNNSNSNHHPHLLPCIKLEHDSERWQPAAAIVNLHSNKLLLQSSEDPLISHGAHNVAHDEDTDHPFKTLLARKCEQQRASHNGTCSSLTKQQLKANLMNARKMPKPTTIQPEPNSRTRASKPKKRAGQNGAVKLRFHHQALPAEYAAHYEATQARQASKPASAAGAAAKATPTPPAANQSHENVRSWLRTIAELQRSAERQQQAQGAVKPAATNLATTVATTEPSSSNSRSSSSKRAAIKYEDLPYMGEITLNNYKPRRGRKPKKADICHLIYKNYGTIIPAAATTALPQLPTTVGKSQGQAVRPAQLAEEPLNLCLRDQSSDRYSISSGDSDKPSTSATTTPTTDRVTPLSLDLPQEQQPRVAAKLLLQPVGLYYQQLMGVPVQTIEKDNQLSLKIPIPSGFFANSPTTKPLEQPLASEPLTPKRKRSAIFIPPPQADHSSSPSTEVSICKFKFTGGARPTLQEKKMLSVDAEGNYRYYNGTGDRAMRGYEFISREQQQQQHQQANQQDKLYVDIPPPSTDLSLELLHIPAESPTTSLLMSSSLAPVAPQSPASYTNSQSPLTLTHNEEYQQRLEQSSSPRPVSKRRASRRSKQREKLEKTFKEKGFLIQTQQLQSAEGATYCKFRQLKKFTRYLFRNWKDHIPESDLSKPNEPRIEQLLAGQMTLGGVEETNKAI